MKPSEDAGCWTFSSLTAAIGVRLELLCRTTIKPYFIDRSTMKTTMNPCFIDRSTMRTVMKFYFIESVTCFRNRMRG